MMMVVSGDDVMVVSGDDDDGGGDNDDDDDYGDDNGDRVDRYFLPWEIPAGKYWYLPVNTAKQILAKWEMYSFKAYFTLKHHVKDIV